MLVFRFLRSCIIRYKVWLLFLLLYTLITLLFTYPLVLHFTTNIVGGEEDAPVHVWYYWWFFYSLFVLRQNPLFTDYIYYPQIINRTFDIHTFVNAAFALPLQLMFGLITASNIVFIFTLVLNALSAAVLANYLTKSKKAAFLAGFIFGFFPYVFAQAADGHTNLISLWFIPFFLYFLLRTIHEKTTKNALLAGLFLGLLGLNDLTTTSFTLALIALVLAYYLVFYRSVILNIPTIKKLLLAGVTFALIFSPLMIAAFYTILKGFKPGVPLWVQSFWSARMEMFLTPSAWSTFLKSYANPTWLNAVESTMYLGFTVIVTSLMSFFFFFKAGRETRKQLGLFYFLTLAFLVLSLGPYLYIKNVKTGIPLPFVFFHVLPLIGGVQEPVRIQPLTILGLSVLSAFTFKFLADSLSSHSGLSRIRIDASGFARSSLTRVTSILINNFSWLLLIILSGLITYEYLPIPMDTTKIDPPQVYNEIAKESGDFAVMDLPLGWNTGQFALGVSPLGLLQYYQTIHHKKIFRATVARLPAQNITYYNNIPGIHYLSNPSVAALPIDTDPDLVKETFKNLKVKYIIIHKKYYSNGRSVLTEQSKEIIINYLKAKLVSDDDQVSVYVVEY